MKETISVLAYQSGGEVSVSVQADVEGGLAVHPATNNPDTYTLTAAACGRAICSGKKQRMNALRRQLLAADIPWEEITSLEAAEPYHSKVARIVWGKK